MMNNWAAAMLKKTEQSTEGATASKCIQQTLLRTAAQHQRDIHRIQGFLRQHFVNIIMSAGTHTLCMQINPSKGRITEEVKGFRIFFEIGLCVCVYECVHVCICDCIFWPEVHSMFKLLYQVLYK